MSILNILSAEELLRHSQYKLETELERVLWAMIRDTLDEYIEMERDYREISEQLETVEGDYQNLLSEHKALKYECRELAKSNDDMQEYM